VGGVDGLGGVDCSAKVTLKKSSDSFSGGIRVIVWIFGEELVDIIVGLVGGMIVDLAVDVREGASSIY